MHAKMKTAEGNVFLSFIPAHEISTFPLPHQKSTLAHLNIR